LLPPTVIELTPPVADTPTVNPSPLETLPCPKATSGPQARTEIEMRARIEQREAALLASALRGLPISDTGREKVANLSATKRMKHFEPARTLILRSPENGGSE
jgi:hypothetical protein